MYSLLFVVAVVEVVSDPKAFSQTQSFPAEKCGAKGGYRLRRLARVFPILWPFLTIFVQKLQLLSDSITPISLVIPDKVLNH